MLKIDLKRNLRHLLNPAPKSVEVIDAPAMAFLMIDGAGDPNTSPSYREAVSALYSLSYTIKFMLKKGPEAIDYSVMPLEGLWWTDDPSQFSLERKGDWKWTMMILQPEFVAAGHVASALEEAGRKKDLPALPLARFETLREGLSAQIMHLGPYATEPPTIQKLHAFIAEHGYAMNGKHHEIYLSDPARTAPERLKTIIRQPIR